MQINILEESVDRINRRKSMSRFYVFMIGFLRSVCLAGFAIGVWEIIRHGAFSEEIVIFLVCFLFNTKQTMMMINLILKTA